MKEQTDTPQKPGARDLILADLVGTYPVSEKLEETPEYKRYLAPELERLTQTWDPLYAAARLIDAKLSSADRYQSTGRNLIHGLDRAQEREKWEILTHVKKATQFTYNKRKLDEIATFFDTHSYTPLLITRDIHYYQEDVYWALGAGEDHGYDRVTQSHFTQALDLICGEDYLRLAIGGDCNLVETTPYLRINQVSLAVLTKPRTQWELLKHLQNISLEEIHKLHWSGNQTSVLKGGFALQTQMQGDEFYEGQRLEPGFGRLRVHPRSEYVSQPTLLTNSKDYFIPAVQTLIHLINAPLGTVPLYRTPRSHLHYSSATGKPLFVEERTLKELAHKSKGTFS